MDKRGSDDADGKSNVNNAIAFTSIGLQMLVTILLFAYGGRKLDDYIGEGSRTWSLILTLTGVLAALYFMIKGFMKVLRK